MTFTGGWGWSDDWRVMLHSTQDQVELIVEVLVELGNIYQKGMSIVADFWSKHLTCQGLWNWQKICFTCLYQLQVHGYSVDIWNQKRWTCFFKLLTLYSGVLHWVLQPGWGGCQDMGCCGAETGRHGLLTNISVYFKHNLSQAELSWVQINFGSKKCWAKKVWLQNDLGKNKIGSKEFSVQMIFGQRKMGGPKNLWVKKFWVKQFFGPTNFESKKILDPRKN